MHINMLRLLYQKLKKNISYIKKKIYIICFFVKRSNIYKTKANKNITPELQFSLLKLYIKKIVSSFCNMNKTWLSLFLNFCKSKSVYTVQCQVTHFWCMSNKTIVLIRHVFLGQIMFGYYYFLGGWTNSSIFKQEGYFSLLRYTISPATKERVVLFQELLISLTST